MIELTYVEKRYPDSSFYVYVDRLTIGKGEIVGILGDNGSGKTTLLKAIMGIGEIQGGSVSIEGKPVNKQYGAMAFITEEGSFFPNLSPVQYGAFLADFFPNFDLSYYDRLLKFYKLERDKKIGSFSKGQKIKLEISAGLAKRAEYLLMDEPFVGEDMFMRKDLLKMTVSGLRGNETVLITTHLIDEIEHIIDRAIIMHNGRIKTDIHVDDMREQGKSLAGLMAEASGYNENKYKETFGE